ncbi:MAG: pPPM1a, partial [Bacteroidetes bacterium]|nr:pPPM1a [Bacteroidota bacterium]
DGRHHPDTNIHPMDERHFKTLIKLLFKADENRHFTLLCHVTQVDKVKKWFEEMKIPEEKFSICLSVWKYSIWAQDAYVALNDQKGNPVLCEGVHFPRVDDPTVADDIAAQTDKSSLQSYLYFQGGNIIDAGDYVLVGKDYIIDNLGRAYLETEEKIIKSFEALFGKSVISLGREEFIDEEHRKHLGGGIFQPIFHIDMYVTPTGKRSDSGKPIIFVASPRLARQILEEEPGLNDFDEYFDETAQQLSAYYEVKRLPILPTFYCYNKGGDAVPNNYYLSYNNAIIENYGTTSNVYLPTYSQDVDEYTKDTDTLKYDGTTEKRQKLDDAAKEIWENLGYTVYQMDGLEDLALGWGSVHCITKTLVRRN